MSCLQFGETYLISGSADKTMIVMNLFTKKPLHSLRVGNGITCLQMDEKEQIVVCGCISGDLQCWNFVTNQLLVNYEKHSREVICLRFGSNILASASNFEGKVFDLKTGRKYFSWLQFNLIFKIKNNRRIIIFTDWTYFRNILYSY